MSVPRLVSRLGSTAAVLVALAGASLAQQPDAAEGIAAENARLSAQIADGAKALERVTAELEALRKAKGDLDESMQRIERRAQVHALGREFAQTLIERRRVLPAPERFAAAREARARLLAATSDANVRVERELGELRWTAIRPRARRHAARPRSPGSPRLQQALVKTLREADAAERDLEQHGQAARATLTRLLFWIPAPPSTQTASELVPALAWTVSPANWRAAGAVLREAIARQPFWPALALLAAVLLVAFRGRLQRTLVSLAPAAVTYERYRIGHASRRSRSPSRSRRPSRSCYGPRRRCSGMRPMPSRSRTRSATRSRGSPGSSSPCPPSRGCSTAAAWRSVTSAGTRRRSARRRARCAGSRRSSCR